MHCKVVSGRMTFVEPLREVREAPEGMGDAADAATVDHLDAATVGHRGGVEVQDQGEGVTAGPLVGRLEALKDNLVELAGLEAGLQPWLLPPVPRLGDMIKMPGLLLHEVTDHRHGGLPSFRE